MVVHDDRLIRFFFFFFFYFMFFLPTVFTSLLLDVFTEEYSKRCWIDNLFIPNMKNTYTKIYTKQ